MTQTLIAWINVAKLSTVAATSSEAAMPPENTLQDIGDASLGWQTAATVTTATLTYTLAEPALVRVIGIFRTNLTNDAIITATITYDGIETWTETLAGPVAGYGQVVFVLDSAEYVDSVAIEIEDETNSDGFINVPLVFIGSAWLPTYSVAPSLEESWLPSSNIQVTRGGQKFVTSLYNPRSMSFEFGAVVESEAYVAAKELARLQSIGTNILVIPDAESDNVKYDALFGMITDCRPTGALPGGSRVRRWGATVEERL